MAENRVRKIYKHSPLDLEHNGVKAHVDENGLVTFNNDKGDEKEYDQITVPATLIYRLAKAMNLTKKITFEEVKK